MYPSPVNALSNAVAYLLLPTFTHRVILTYLSLSLSLYVAYCRTYSSNYNTFCECETVVHSIGCFCVSISGNEFGLHDVQL